MKEKYPRTIKKDQRKKINKHMQGNVQYQYPLSKKKNVYKEMKEQVYIEKKVSL